MASGSFEACASLSSVASGEALPEEPDTAADRKAVNDTRVSIWFEEQKDFYSGFVHYDNEYDSVLARDGKAADNDGSGSPMHYLLKYDDGAGEHGSWRAIQIGIRNITTGGFIDVAHQHPPKRAA